MLNAYTADPQTLAVILLIMRLIAAGLIGAVLVTQIRNMRRYATDYPAVRITVFLLTLTLFLGQFLPIILDAVVAFGELYPGRPHNPQILQISYTINNAVKDMVIGSLLAFLYFRPHATQPPKMG